MRIHHSYVGIILIILSLILFKADGGFAHFGLVLFLFLGGVFLLLHDVYWHITHRIH